MLLVTTEVSNLFVCALGIGTVFLGLVCLIVLCKVIGFFCNRPSKKAPVAAAEAPQQKATVSATPIQNKQEIIAAVSAAIAEELGTDVSAIRITSFKKL